MVDHYSKNRAKAKIVADLLAHPFSMTGPIPVEYTKVKDSAMHDLGIGTMHTMKDVVSGLFIPSLLFREYSAIEKINLWRGKAHSGISILWNEMISHDLSVERRVFQIPVYFIHGIFDYTCSYELAREYFEKIEAPKKQFFPLGQSAHSPIFEEPEECIKIIRARILIMNETL